MSNKKLHKKNVSDYETNEAPITDVATGIKTLEGTLGIITSEDRARTSLYSDPVTLNFKLLIDWKSPYGLFGNGVNSAISYFNRIGDFVRADATKRFIDEFQKFVRDYDFLILSCEGLQEIYNRNPWNVPVEGEENVTFTVRETADLKMQALLNLYHNIWWDDVRMVEVLPANLRRFNCCVLVYSSGYFNNLLYGVREDTDYEKEPEKFVFPTKPKLDKLNKIGEALTKDSDFNHMRVNLIDAQINFNESGKTFFGELSNEMNSDYVKNTLSFKYRFSNTTGLFTTVSGNKYLTDVLILMNEMNKEQQQTGGGGGKKKSFIKKYFDGLKDSFNSAAKGQWNSIKNKGISIAEKYTKNLGDTVIGNSLNQFLDPSKLVGMVDNAVTAGVGILENRLLSNVTELENLVSRNFSPEILTNAIYDLDKKFDKQLDKLNIVGTLLNKGSKAHGNQYTPEGINLPNDSELNANLPKVGETPENPNMKGPTYSPEAVPENIVKGISFKDKSNVFTRETF